MILPICSEAPPSDGRTAKADRTRTRHARCATTLALFAVLVQGCATRASLHRVVLDYDDAVSQAQAEMLLLNVARAKHQRPFHLTTPLQRWIKLRSFGAVLDAAAQSTGSQHGAEGSALKVVESSERVADAHLSVAYAGKCYAIPPEPQSQRAFRILYRIPDDGYGRSWGSCTSSNNRQMISFGLNTNNATLRNQTNQRSDRT
jgi:hypothetical protein